MFTIIREINGFSWPELLGHLNPESLYVLSYIFPVCVCVVYVRDNKPRKINNNVTYGTLINITNWVISYLYKLENHYSYMR